jgi:EAL domain-containing protein (putative c-di-GMP-specific phosphodiesterase class I)
MLTGFGGSYCPMMRLSNFSVDYVMLSPEVANYIGRDERSDNAVKSIISFVNDIGSEPVADGVFNSRQAEMLYSFECSYCAGSLSGKYVTEKYVKRRTDT